MHEHDLPKHVRRHFSHDYHIHQPKLLIRVPIANGIKLECNLKTTNKNAAENSKNVCLGLIYLVCNV